MSKKEIEKPEDETSEDNLETEESEESTDKDSTKDKKRVSEDSKEIEDEDTKEEKKPTKFFDPNKVPEELKPVWKSMQGSFTRAMQAARHSSRKAEAFDELVANSEFQAWVASKNEAPSKKRKATVSDDDDEDDKTVPDIEGMIERAVAKSLAPIVRGEHRKTAQAEWDKLVEDHPQAENYKDEISEQMRELPGIGYLKAFKMVAFDDALGIGGESAMRSVASKKRANTSTPSKTNLGDKDPPQAKSIPEAFKLALKQQKEKGERS